MNPSLGDRKTRNSKDSVHVRIHTCMSAHAACIHTHTHLFTLYSLYQGNQKSKLLGPLCPFPSPLGHKGEGVSAGTPQGPGDLGKEVCEEKQLGKGCREPVQGMPKAHGRQPGRTAPDPSGKPPGSQPHDSWLPELGQTQTEQDWQQLGLGRLPSPRLE